MKLNRLDHLEGYPQPTDDTPSARRARENSTKTWCLRCGMPWDKAEPHVTVYRPPAGIFPLCYECWGILGTPDARLPYYKSLMQYFHTHDLGLNDEAELQVMRAVVMGG